MARGRKRVGWWVSGWVDLPVSTMGLSRVSSQAVAVRKSTLALGAAVLKSGSLSWMTKLLKA